MPFEIRPVTEEEFPRYARSIATVFGEGISDEDIADWAKITDVARTVAVFDGDAIVGTNGSFAFQLTVPGLRTLPAAGVTAVSVLPTHRRQGLLTKMMRYQLDDLRERGEPLAILLASESIIYGRFGYGLATDQADLRIRRAYGAFSRAPETPGSIRLLDKEEAAKVLPGIYDRFRHQVPGQVDRESGWWDDYFKDNPRDRRGASQRYYVAYTDGQAEGYAAYRIKGEWPGGIPSGTAQVHDLITTTPGAYTALWRYLLDLDLVDTITVSARPLDEPLRWMLADPRRLRFEDVGDAIWLRVADVQRALESRRYMVEGALSLNITDSFCPENEGTYRLEGGPDGAICKRTDGSADLSLDVADLGAAYLGGTRLNILAASRRVREHSRGALRLADAMFGSDIAPWCTHHF